MGTLTKKIQCQDRFSMMTPPTVGPVTMPMETMEPAMPRARPRSCGGKASVTNARPNARMSAAPMPCNTLKPISQPTVGDSPHSNEPMVKTMKPEL